MNVTFSSDFDLGAWPGPLGQSKAVTGEAWVGQHGLLSLLETALGLKYPAEPDAVRAAALVPTIQGTDGFWSDSAEVDPFGTARKLLSWRDRLHLCGWRGEPVSLRLEQLGKVTKTVLPGFADRLDDISDHLGKRKANINRIGLVDDFEQLPLAWQSALRGLEHQGTKVEPFALCVAKGSKGDLGAAQQGSFAPTVDGSLQLLRAAGPLAAAHEIAAWLTAQDSIDDTVIIGASSALDQALHRFGLPTAGYSQATDDNTFLQVLPLVLEMGWYPPDPQRALELLTLKVSPVPKGIAGRLADALQTWPAVNSDLWREALAEGLKSIKDPDRRGPVGDRLQAIFASPVKGPAYPVAEIQKRIKVLTAWSRGRLGTAEPGEREYWLAIIRQMDNLVRLVELSGLDGLSPAQLMRAVQDATSDVSLPPPMEAQAGIAAVGGPGCIAGPAQNIVWWNFTRESAPGPFNLPLTVEERKALVEAGVLVPDPGDEALWLARRWRRPLAMASKVFLAVCPATGEDGEDHFPHPLWDEISSSSVDGVDELELTSLLGAPGKAQRKVMQAPGTVEKWQVPAGVIGIRAKESPSSLEKLISCPFRWVISYLGRVWPGGVATIPTGPLLEGKLIHELIARVFAKWPLGPAQAADEAERLLEQEGPRLAAPIFQPGQGTILAGVRRSLVSTARQVTQLLQDAGWDPVAFEKSFEEDIPELGARLKGIPDLVAGPSVVDFKRSGATFWGNRLANGSATQLACYGRLLGGAPGKAFPPAGIFILTEGRLITNDGGAFPKADEVSGRGFGDTWAALVEAVKQETARLSNGNVQATGNGDDCPKDSYLDKDDHLIIAPSCNFCDHGVLCGLELRQ
jgi:ATP-dependent helicase/nuclease subunit B